ncbi:PD-(D/E)XK motif protein [Cryobacterium breve]|uniref:PD-(D/E)XK motif protein n=1 Tax=Cryobacterium breve TaxID=1259258 RepID=A0ABY7NHE0_9MICO|nr:PD-(D/E)XK motif protein [Cryobacterium breve]WBM80903.1 PD-(D/E)XK motif protein [Cryobacterium breve]
MTSYESVPELILDVSSAVTDELRDITWVTDAQVVGVSRDHGGRVEVFLVGVELRPTSKTVGDAIEFRTWHREGAASFEANRLLLPALGHFDQVAAFICTELLRNGADTVLSLAFTKTEPIVELAIERLRMSNEVVLGLAGELLMLDALCRRADDENVAQAVESWDGWRKSSRDFVWGSTGVEVKTTTRSTSSHLVQGVHQVELNDGEDGGVPEDRLYLVSIGLQATATGGNSFSIPQLVVRIIERMEATGCGGDVLKFLSRTSEYGVESGGGYDHNTMSEDPIYGTSFQTSFFRAYDMSDEAVEILRRDDIAVRHHVDVSSVRFRIDLPVTARTDNPVSGANQVAEAVFGSPA